MSRGPRVLRLLRHATAAPSEGDDRERPLDARGRAEAEAVGLRLAAAGAVPALALCSPARRARETLEILCAQLPRPPRTLVADDLYLAPPGGILGRIQDLDDAVADALVVGHNPGLAALARGLAGTGAPPGFPFPPAALAVIAFDGPAWADLAPGRARLVELVGPHGA